jgi:hypothetical protein
VVVARVLLVVVAVARLHGGGSGSLVVVAEDWRQCSGQRGGSTVAAVGSTRVASAAR